MMVRVRVCAYTNNNSNARARKKRERRREALPFAVCGKTRERVLRSFSLPLKSSNSRRRKRVPNFFAQNHFRVSKLFRKENKKRRKRDKTHKKSQATRADSSRVPARVCARARARRRVRVCVCVSAFVYSFLFRALALCWYTVINI